jgi:hypothetical protein
VKDLEQELPNHSYHWICDINLINNCFLTALHEQSQTEPQILSVALDVSSWEAGSRTVAKGWVLKGRVVEGFEGSRDQPKIDVCRTDCSGKERLRVRHANNNQLDVKERRYVKKQQLFFN